MKSEWVGFEQTNIKKAHRQNRETGFFYKQKESCYGPTNDAHLVLFTETTGSLYKSTLAEKPK